MNIKFCACALFLFTVCYGQDSHNFNIKSTSENHSYSMEMKRAANTTLTQLLQSNATDVYYLNDYDDDTYPSKGLTVGVPVVTILVIVCCLYYCCRCRTQRNQGMVMTVHPPPPLPAPATHIIIQHQASPGQQPAMAGVPPPYPPQQHVPPPYDTQPMWSPQAPQQQFHQQAPPQQFHQQPLQQQFNQQVPTSYDNPNYGQPPVNPKY